MKCILIVSQYHGDIQGFIVKYRSTTEDDWKKFICDLEDYKRSKEDKKEYYFGDFEGVKTLDYRHNVNDISGDIYVLLCPSVGNAVEQLERIKRRDKVLSGRRYKKELLEHHNGNELEEIMKKHFEIL